MKAVLKLVAIFCCFIVSLAQAEDVKVGSLTLSDFYIRAVPASAKVTSGYMKIHNHGSQSDRLLGVYSPAVSRIEIHEMKMEDNVMRMRPLRQGLELPAGEVVSLEPGGYHLMIFEPKREFVKGETVPLTLRFSDDKMVVIRAEIRDIAADKKTQEMDEHHHTHTH